MPQSQTDQTTDLQAGDAVFEELRVLIRDVRSWLEAMPVPTEPILFDMAPIQGAVGSAPDVSGRPGSGVIPDTAQLDAAVAALNAHADTLSATAERAAEAVRERGDRIDAILAEISRIRAETIPA